MAQQKRVSMGVTLPSKLVGTLDRLRNQNSPDKQFAGRDRSYVIEKLCEDALEERNAKS